MTDKQKLCDLAKYCRQYKPFTYGCNHGGHCGKIYAELKNKQLTPLMVMPKK